MYPTEGIKVGDISSKLEHAITAAVRGRNI
jgi:hypothetical protein